MHLSGRVAPNLGEALGAAADRMHQATADTRKRYELQETIVRRTLLAICMMAAER